MAKFPEEFIAQVKSANDIVELFRNYADLKKRGRIYVCCCPFHAEKTPSCTIYPESSSFYCFGCHVGGDVMKFVMLTNQVSYAEAVQILAQRSGLPMPVQNPEFSDSSGMRDRCYEINRETANFYYQNLLTGSDKTGLQYLKSYGILPSTVKKYALGYASDNHNLYEYLRKKGYSEKELEISGLCRNQQDYFRNRIIFPSVDFRGNVGTFCGMTADGSQPAFLYMGNTPVSSRNQFIFSLRFARKESNFNFMILAEDCFQVITLWQAGFKNAIAVPNFLTKHHVKKLSQYTKEVILIQSQNSHFGDLQTIQNHFSEAEMQVRVLILEEVSDSAEFLRNYGAEAFQKRLLNAGDAVQTALEHSWSGLNQTEDRQAVIQQSAKVLAGIKDELEREVYLSEIAQKLKITPDQMQAQIDQISNKPVKIQTNSTLSLSIEELMKYSRKQEKS